MMRFWKTAIVILIYTRQAWAFVFLKSPVIGLYSESKLQAISPKEESNPGGELLDKALKLRQEAYELQNNLQKEKGSRQQNENLSLPQYKDVKDSVWLLSYLFLAKPAPKDEKSQQEQDGPWFSRFGGKLVIRFTTNGYTDFLSHNPVTTNKNNRLEVVKLWGWDLERSNNDGKDYLLFSMDAKLPDGTKERFYFQSRQIINDYNGEVSFEDGTVTIKQDVVQSGSKWGLFSPQGILAQFRFVGDFTLRPSRDPTSL